MRDDIQFGKMPKDWNYFLAGDLHLGNAAHYSDGWEQFIQTVESSYTGRSFPEYGGLPASRNYVGLHGDTMDCITINDKRFCLFTQKKPMLNSLLEYSYKQLIPIKKRILYILKGNHEHVVFREYGDIVNELCGKLGVEYGTYSAIVSFSNMKYGLQFKHFCTHGKGPITSQAKDPVQAEANMLASLKLKLKNKNSSCVLMSMGDTHKLLILPPLELLYLKHEDGRIKQGYTSQYIRNPDGWPQNKVYIDDYLRWYVNTGSFLKLYIEPQEIDEETIHVTSYAELRNLDPTELGYCVALIRDNRIVGVEKEVI